MSIQQALGQDLTSLGCQGYVAPRTVPEQIAVANPDTLLQWRELIDKRITMLHELAAKAHAVIQGPHFTHDELAKLAADLDHYKQENERFSKRITELLNQNADLNTELNRKSYEQKNQRT